MKKLGGRRESGFGYLSGGPEEAVVDFVTDLCVCELGKKSKGVLVMYLDELHWGALVGECVDDIAGVTYERGSVMKRYR